MPSSMFIHRKLLLGQRKSKWPRTVKLHLNHLSKKVLYLVLCIFWTERPCRQNPYNAVDICPKYLDICPKQINITYTTKRERKELCPWEWLTSFCLHYRGDNMRFGDPLWKALNTYSGNSSCSMILQFS